MPPPNQAGSIPLYAEFPQITQQEIWERSYRGEPWVRNVSTPTLIPVLPDPGVGNGVAVVIAPGGAFRALSVTNEGLMVARWLADRGIAAFVLKYRLEPTPPDPAEYQALLNEFQRRFATGEVTAADLDVPREALADGQAAVRLVRARASEWNIDPERVGFMGFSAGAMTAVAVAIESSPAARPDFVLTIYPSMLPVDVPADAPPMFLVLASDDPLFGNQGYGLIESWKAAGCEVEFHLFERGGHGFGMRRQDLTSDRWPRLLQEWMHMHGWAPSADKTA
ncbi:alpha/beta hydrolase [Bradyrhizobium japonicum]|uniref:alpha/beta hydrolase n=1 Tax=Bradyrhizobium japonicum TaxID=375 RepID=UPI001BAB7E99|nr:alpha/beta hydrolase [Bradyrhizobium japonicum]MBR0995577.1 alpha/beta hydrolase [Bradyrhizobium japonicum]